MQDHQRHERDQDLRAGIERAVQDIGKEPEHSEEQKEDAVFSYVSYSKSCKDSIEAYQCEPCSVFVEQDIIESRVRSEQLKQFQQI